MPSISKHLGDIDHMIIFTATFYWNLFIVDTGYQKFQTSRPLKLFTNVSTDLKWAMTILDNAELIDTEAD